MFWTSVFQFITCLTYFYTTTGGNLYTWVGRGSGSHQSGLYIVRGCPCFAHENLSRELQLFQTQILGSKLDIPPHKETYMNRECPKKFNKVLDIWLESDGPTVGQDNSAHVPPPKQLIMCCLEHSLVWQVHCLMHSAQMQYYVVLRISVLGSGGWPTVPMVCSSLLVVYYMCMGYSWVICSVFFFPSLCFVPIRTRECQRLGFVHLTLQKINKKIYIHIYNYLGLFIRVITENGTKPFFNLFQCKILSTRIIFNLEQIKSFWS